MRIVPSLSDLDLFPSMATATAQAGTWPVPRRLRLSAAKTSMRPVKPARLRRGQREVVPARQRHPRPAPIRDFHLTLT